MATPTFKSNTGDQKVYARKRIYHCCLVRLENSIPQDHCLASLGKALRDAKQWPSDGIFYPHLPPMKDSNSLFYQNPQVLGNRTSKGTSVIFFFFFSSESKDLEHFTNPAIFSQNLLYPNARATLESLIKTSIMTRLLENGQVSLKVCMTMHSKCFFPEKNGNPSL